MHRKAGTRPRSESLTRMDCRGLRRLPSSVVRLRHDVRTRDGRLSEWLNGLGSSAGDTRASTRWLLERGTESSQLARTGTAWRRSFPTRGDRSRSPAPRGRSRAARGSRSEYTTGPGPPKREQAGRPLEVARPWTMMRSCRKDRRTWCSRWPSLDRRRCFPGA